MELAVDRLTKQYKNKIAVDRVSFSFHEDALWDFGTDRRRGGI